MKTLTAPTEIARTRPWARPRRYLRLDLTMPTPLRLVLSDRYYRRPAGPNLVVNGTFPTDLAGWSTPFGGSLGVWDSGAGGRAALEGLGVGIAQERIVVPGALYRLSVGIASSTVRVLVSSHNDGSADLYNVTHSPGTTEVVLSSLTGVMWLTFLWGVSSLAHVDNITLTLEPVEALARVIDWGAFGGALNRFDGGASPRSGSLVLDNTLPVEGTTAQRLSDLIPLYQWGGGTVTIFDLLDEDHAGADAVPAGVYVLEEPEETSGETLTLTMADRALALEDALDRVVTKVTAAAFPAAPAASLDHRIPYAFGHPKNCAAFQIVDGAESTLDGAITSTATTLTLVGASRFPASGKVRIDGEHIAYSGKSGNGLTGLTHAQDTTTAEDHAHDALVQEIRTGDAAYRFVVCEHRAAHKTLAITNIKIAGEDTPGLLATLAAEVRVGRGTKPQRPRVAGVPSVITPSVVIDDGTLIPGKFFAVIDLPEQAKFYQQNAITATRTVAVSTINIQIDGSVGSPASPQTRTVAPSSIGGTTQTERKLNWRVVRSDGPDGTVESWTIKRRLSGGSDVVVATGRFDNLGSTSGSHTRIYNSVANEIITFSFVVSNTNNGTLELIFDQYKVTDHATVVEGGGPTAIGAVTCDVDGVQDDGSITGGNGVLENPADIAKYVHRDLLGLGPGLLSAGWAATRSELSNLGYTWSLLLGPTPYSELRRQMSEQARCALVWSRGVVDFRFLPDRPDPVVDLDSDDDFLADPALVIRRTPPAEIRNSLTVSHRHHWASGAFEATVTRELPGLTDATRRPGVLELPFVIGAAMAASLGDFWLARWGTPKIEVDGTGFHNLVHLDPGDPIRVAHPALAAGRPVVLQLLDTRDAYRTRGLTALEVARDRLVATFAAGDPFMAYGSRGNRSERHATNATQWTLLADFVILRDVALTTIKLIDNPASITLDIATAGPVANGRDQASAFGVDSWGHAYWIWNGTLLRGIASASAPPTVPTLPTGYTHWAYEGAFRIDGSVNIVKMYHRGDRAFWQAVINLVNAQAPTVETAVSLTSVIPPNAMAALIQSRGEIATVATTTHTDSWLLRLLTAVDWRTLSAVHSQVAGVRWTDQAELEVPNVGQNFYYLHGGHGGNGGTIAMTLDALGYTMPTGAS